MDESEMIKSLRRRHFYTWVVLAALLPVGFVSAYLVIPEQAIRKGDVPPVSEVKPLSEIIFTKDMKDFLLNVRQENGQQQIELVIKQPLTVPASILYLSDDAEPKEIDQALLLGAIETRGIYRFNYSHAHDYLLFRDGIGQSIYKSVELR